jgi:hypothetical protein
MELREALTFLPEHAPTFLPSMRRAGQARDGLHEANFRALLCGMVHAAAMAEETECGVSS